MTILTRNELNQKYGITKNIWNTRHDDLINHLQDFMDIKEIKSERNRYTYEIEGEIP